MTAEPIDIIAAMQAAIAQIEAADRRPRRYVIVPPRLAAEARETYGAENVVVSEYLPAKTAYVYTPPPGLGDPLVYP